MQCPRCGREVDDLVRGLCSECRSEREAFLVAPEVLDLTRCAHCGKLEVDGGWMEVPSGREGTARVALAKRVEVDPSLTDSELSEEFTWENEHNGTTSLKLQGTYHGRRVERSASVRLRFKNGACPDCSRRHGGYFESIIQLRSSPGAPSKDLLERMSAWLDEEVHRLGRDGRKGAFFSRSEKVRGGVDDYVGSQEIARILGRGLAERHGASYAESSKLVGRRDGVDLHRVTILVRLPPFGGGDFVELDGRPYKVLSFEGKLLSLWDLERLARVRRDPRRAKTLKRIGAREDELEAIVVSRHGRFVQILDPRTLRTVDLEPTGVPADAQSFHVFYWNERYYPVPSEARPAYTRQ